MTAHQIELMIMAMEDAQHHQQNIYLLQIYFSEAFDTINHNKLIQIMADLGYPARAVQAVKDLYTEATTSYSYTIRLHATYQHPPRHYTRR